MKRLPLVVPFLTFAMFSACQVGPSADGIRTLGTGEGITIQLTRTSSSIARYFELLAADADGIYVRSLESPGRNLYRFSYDRIARAQFQGLRRLNFRSGKPDSRRIREIQLVSRYPQGMTDELRDALLLAYEQEAFQTSE